MTMDMFVDIGICGFQITCIFNITKVNKYFVGILNSWIVLLTKYTKLNVQWIEMMSQYLKQTYQTFMWLCHDLVVSSEPLFDSDICCTLSL